MAALLRHGSLNLGPAMCWVGGSTFGLDVTEGERDGQKGAWVGVEVKTNSYVFITDTSRQGVAAAAAIALHKAGDEMSENMRLWDRKAAHLSELLDASLVRDKSLCACLHIKGTRETEEFAASRQRYLEEHGLI